MKNNYPPRRLAEAALIAAMYTTLCIVLANVSFGPVQFRLAEALTILPVFAPASAIPGLAVGCFLSNLYGLFTHTNPLGPWDLLVGTLATLVAAVLTWRLRNWRLTAEPHGWRFILSLPVIATLPPVAVNAFVIGPELYFAFGGPLWGWIGEVALTQFAMCTIGGLVLYTALKRTGADKRIFA